MVYEYEQFTWTLTFNPKKNKNPRDVFFQLWKESLRFAIKTSLTIGGILISVYLFWLD